MSQKISVLREQLSWLQTEGVLHNYIVSTPGDRGRRWNVWGPGFHASYSSRELEVWISGALTMWTHLKGGEA